MVQCVQEEVAEKVGVEIAEVTSDGVQNAEEHELMEVRSEKEEVAVEIAEVTSDEIQNAKEKTRSRWKLGQITRKLE